MSVDFSLNFPVDLLEVAEKSASERLLASPFAALLPGEVVADLFCGAGGWGEGAKRVGVQVDFAINHDEMAIATHKANNPACTHHRGDAWRAKPRDVMRGKILGLLLASAACTSHSRAKGDIPVSPRVHMLGWCIARWMRECKPRIVLIENVPEWQDWGPLTQRKSEAGFEWDVLGEDGKPSERVHGPSCRTSAGAAWRRLQKKRGKIVRPVLHADPDRKGQHYRRFVRYCKKLGYQVEARVLDAPDFGSPSRRKRLFIMARRDGAPICWPEKTHGRLGCVGTAGVGSTGQSGLDSHISMSESSGGAAHAGVHQAERRFHTERARKAGADRLSEGRSFDQPASLVPHVAPYRTAAEIIDWSDLGKSIFERTTPLKPKTLARIVEGIRRHVLNDPAPFVLRVTHGDGWHVSPVDGTMPTQTTRQDLAVCTPIISKQYGANRRSWVGGSRVDDKLGSITAIDHHALCTPIISPCGGPKRQPEKVAGLMGTVLTREDRGVCVPVMVPTRNGERSGQRPRTVDLRESGPTVTCGVQHGLFAPVLTRYNGEKVGDPANVHRVDESLYTVPTENRFGIAAPVMAYLNHGGKQTGRVDESLRTVMSQGTHAMLVAALMMEYYGNGTLRRPDDLVGALRTHENQAIVCCVIDGVEMVIVDILFRMLKPHELAAAMGFPADFQWPKTKRDTVRQIGNAVQVDQAAALVGAALPRMKKTSRKVAV